MTTKTLRRPDRNDRAERRLKVRDAAYAKVQALRDWRQERAEQAAKRAKDRAAELRKQPRGVDRVPAHLTGLAVTEQPHLTGKRGTTLAQPEDLHPAGNYATRRARGHRGHDRPTRRRDMPGAVERRIERNRKAWQAQQDAQQDAEDQA